MENRRNFLKKTSLLAAGGLLAGKAGLASAAKTASAETTQNASKILGLQIYSVQLRGELNKDVPGGLKKLAEMGYTNLELAGYNDGKINDVSMSDFKKMCNDVGLKVVSSHVNPPAREYTKDNKKEILDFWKKVVDEHAQIGVKYLIQPGQPATRSTEEVAFVGEIFTEAGKLAKAGGLLFGYHNHEGEFARVIPGGTASVFGRGGFGRDVTNAEIIYDGLMKSTDPEYVLFELDVYWTVMGQQDPVEYMQKYADRIKVLHIKDKSVLGQSGMMNFEMIYKQAYTNGIKDFFVELESNPNGTQFEGVKGCADYLLNAPFVK